jgi:drug/metabolite transporter (DMT)-like permease
LDPVRVRIDALKMHNLRLELSRRGSPHLTAVLQAFFVTFLWATSWVLIKIGLGDIPALTFAGLRYTLAFLCLLPFALRRPSLRALAGLDRRTWGRLLLLGVLYYAVTQGTQFIGLALLPAVTVTLLLSFTVVLVALMGIPLLGERPWAMQWVGVAVSIAGILLYFYPPLLPAGQVAGLLVVILGVVTNAMSALLGRSVNRQGALSPLLVTTVSMGTGALLLLGGGLLAQGLPRLSLLSWAIIGWLAVVNTALTFTLWNHTLRTLSATESSMINNTMTIQIAVLAWLFLDEHITGQEIAGLALVALGTLLVQLRRRPAPPAAGEPPPPH